MGVHETKTKDMRPKSEVLFFYRPMIMIKPEGQTGSKLQIVCSSYKVSPDWLDQTIENNRCLEFKMADDNHEVNRMSSLTTLATVNLSTKYNRLASRLHFGVLFADFPNITC